MLGQRHCGNICVVGWQYILTLYDYLQLCTVDLNLKEHRESTKGKQKINVHSCRNGLKGMHCSKCSSQHCRN
jgi:hypothetical protein